MANRTVTVKDIKGNFITAVDFTHDCFPEVADEIPASLVGAAIDKARVTLDVGRDYIITVTRKS